MVILRTYDLRFADFVHIRPLSESDMSTNKFGMQFCTLGLVAAEI